MDNLITLNKEHRSLKKFSYEGKQELEKQSYEYTKHLTNESIKCSEHKSRSKIIEVIASHVCTAASHLKDSGPINTKWYDWVLEVLCALLPLMIGLLYNEQKMAVNELRFWSFFTLTIIYSGTLVFKIVLKSHR